MPGARATAARMDAVRRRLAKLLDDQLAAMKRGAPSFATFEGQILLARASETEACRKYFGHVVNVHGCV